MCPPTSQRSLERRELPPTRNVARLRDLEPDRVVPATSPASLLPYSTVCRRVTSIERKFADQRGRERIPIIS